MIWFGDKSKRSTEAQGGHLVISFLFFTFPFLFLTLCFSLRHFAFRLRFSFLSFTFPFSFLTFWFSLRYLAFRFFFTFPFLFLTFWFLPIYFVSLVSFASTSLLSFFFFHICLKFLFSVFVFAFKLYNENQNLIRIAERRFLSAMGCQGATFFSEGRWRLYTLRLL